MFSHSFAFFSFDLRQCVKYLSLSSTGLMDNDCFFETKNDALSMVWQRVSKIILTVMSITGILYSLNMIPCYIVSMVFYLWHKIENTHDSVHARQVIGDTFGSENKGMLSSAYRHVTLYQGADMHPDGIRYHWYLVPGTSKKLPWPIESRITRFAIKT